MSLTFAYLSIIIIWSTTPLTVQWSAGDNPFFGVAARMLLGFMACWIIILAKGITIPFSSKTLPVYLVTGISLFLAMSFVYWSSQFIPSGWISVLFGLSPVFTAIFSHLFIGERNFSTQKVIGLLLGFIGLLFVFSSSVELSYQSFWGIIACLIAVIISGGSSVWIKQLNQTVELTGMQTNIGGLTIAVPFFILTWLIASNAVIPNLSIQASISIIYLGLIGTTLGFSLYYFLLKNMEATRVSLITLITPVTALILGSWLNNEPIITKVWIGTAFICGGLICFEFRIKAFHSKTKMPAE
ncbi:MAG: DMT family transporter [Arenicella sp.]